MEIRAYQETDASAWDGFCAAAVNATFLHTRLFYSYHADRFKDRSALIHADGDLVGLIPAAEDPSDATRVASHPGCTYGGIVHQGWLNGSKMIEAVGALKAHYAGLGYKTLRYKAIPYFYWQVPSQDDAYALQRHGARRYRVDLSSTIDLASHQEPGKRRRYELKQARAACELSKDAGKMAEFYPVLYQNLGERHQLKPVHTLEEIELLRGRFPGNIFLRTATLQGAVGAGAVVFTSPRVWHIQYMGSTPQGRENFALDLVVEEIINEAKQAGVRYVDFGNSNEEQGAVLNDGLYRYKAKFGAGGTVYEFYDMELK